MRRMLLQGFHLETLLSRALSSGVRLRSVRRVGPRRMRLAASDPRSLSALAERYGVACHDLGPTGLSVLADLLRRRWTLLPAVLLSLFLLLSFSSRVWIVDVESAEGGLSPGLRADVLARMADLGVRPGVVSPDPALLSARLAAACPNLSYVAVHRQGVRLWALVKESGDSPHIYDPRRERDLVADRDGMILSVNVLTGRAAVKPGDTVMRGQPLILGQERGEGDQILGVRALGTVYARAWSEAEASSPLLRAEDVYTGRIRQWSRLVTPFFEVPLTEADPFPRCGTVTRRQSAVGLFVPVCIETTLCREKASRQVKEDPLALSRRLRQEALSSAQRRAPGPILRVWTHTAIQDGQMTVRSVIEYSAQIASDPNTTSD